MQRAPARNGRARARRQPSAAMLDFGTGPAVAAFDGSGATAYAGNRLRMKTPRKAALNGRIGCPFKQGADINI